MQLTSIAQFEYFFDENTPLEMLPEHLRGGSNERRLRYLKKELLRVIESELSETQRDCIRKYYWRGMRKSEIAKARGVRCAQITKSIASAEKTIKVQLTDFLSLYDRLERELLSEQ